MNNLPEQGSGLYILIDIYMINSYKSRYFELIWIILHTAQIIKRVSQETNSSNFCEQFLKQVSGYILLTYHPGTQAWFNVT